MRPALQQKRHALACRSVWGEAYAYIRKACPGGLWLPRLVMMESTQCAVASTGPSAFYLERSILPLGNVSYVLRQEGYNICIS